MCGVFQIAKYEDMVSHMQSDQERLQEQFRKVQTDVSSSPMVPA